MEIFCNGQCEPTDPGGHATWGFVALEPPAGDSQRSIVVHAANGYIGHGPGMTNNLAEYTALIEALKWAWGEGERGFAMYTDSQLCVNQVTGQWAVRAGHLQPLVERVRAGIRSCEVSHLGWVPREQNELADAQSRLAYQAHAGIEESDIPLYIQAIRDLDEMDTELADGFELDFVTSNLGRIIQYGEHTRFSEKQRAIIRKLCGKYFGPEREAEFAGQLRML